MQIEKGVDLLVTFKRTESSGSYPQFCKTRGTAVFNNHPNVRRTDIPAVSIPDLVFEPKLHSHYPERVLSIRDGLPKYKDWDPSFGGTDEVVPE